MGQVMGPRREQPPLVPRPLPLVAWWAFLWVSHGMPRHSAGGVLSWFSLTWGLRPFWDPLAFLVTNFCA